MYYPEGDPQSTPAHAKPSKKKRGWIIGGIIAAVVLVGGSVAFVATGTLSSILHPVADYSGTGTSTSVEFTIAEGDTGEVIATNLQKAGVTKSVDAFYRLLLKTNPEPVFIPGVYTLLKEMSAQSALDALTSGKNRVTNQVVIPEGTIASKVYKLLATSTKIPEADFVAAAKNPQSFGLPAQAKTLEGYLYPATYSFSPNQSANEILTEMTKRALDELSSLGVSAAEQWRVVTMASLVQKESGSVADMPKVSRVFANRLAIDMPLESDATVAYGTGKTNMIETTAAERADASNPYNTYAHAGMLFAPICNPGADAIKAALNPAAGKWLYFVAVNFDTGETVFSETLAQHEKAVQQSQAWWQAHPEYK